MTNLHVLIVVKKTFSHIITILQDEGEVKTLDVKAGGNSKLPKELQDFIKMIFDVESMKKAMMEFEVS